VKELDPETLEAVVPSMLLQPLVENSIKHGLSPKVDGGSITLRSRMEDGLLVIEVADDGVGLTYDGPAGNSSTGIGLTNVAGRIKVLYGDSARMTVSSRDTEGTVVRLRLPILESAEPGDDTAVAAGQRTTQ
jgi:two-component system, LytTR family, sensor kinase